MYGDNEPQPVRRPHRVVLDEAGFCLLVKGKVVRVVAADGHLVEFILSDIGFYQMLAAVHEAMFKAAAYKGWRNDG